MNTCMACALKWPSPSLLRCFNPVGRGTRGLARAKASRYNYYKENEEQIWNEFFANPSRFLDLRHSKAQEHFADFSLKGDSRVALYIGDDPDVEKRLWEVDNRRDPALKASRRLSAA